MDGEVQAVGEEDQAERHRFVVGQFRVRGFAMNERGRVSAGLAAAVSLIAGITAAVLYPGNEDRLQVAASSERPRSASGRVTPETEVAYGPGACSSPGEPANGTYDFALADIEMVSSQRGWAAGRGVILGTRDGREWTPEYTGPERFRSLHVLDPDHVWATADDHLVTSSDGGRSWHRLRAPEQLLRSVHFVDPDRGYAVTGHYSVKGRYGSVPPKAGSLARTSDGGETWEPVPTAPCDVQSVCFTAPEHGWLVIGSRVYRSTDGGQRWQAVLSPPGHWEFGKVGCAPHEAAWVLFDVGEGASSHRGYAAFHTDDGGRNWSPVLTEPYMNIGKIQAPTRPGTYPGTFSVIGPSEAMFVGYTPPLEYPTSTMLASAGGTSLSQRRAVPVTQLAPFTASFVTPDQGWIVGRAEGADLIVATRDGGRTWDTQMQADR